MQTVKKPGMSRAAALDIQSGFGGRYAETDESPQAFVPCGFCCPGAEREAKAVKYSKKWLPPLFRHAEHGCIHAAAELPQRVACYHRAWALK